jgi:hypothetical protein
MVQTGTPAGMASHALLSWRRRLGELIRRRVTARAVGDDAGVAPLGVRRRRPRPSFDEHSPHHQPHRPTPEFANVITLVADLMSRSYGPASC